ncbi:MAG: Hsp20/alpha crystallin family protein [Clostridiales bacterium]|jgi:HSP20 family protein|nr:Hsp20/alpha crystallin family protein [Clostridiales bacterium]
MAGLIPFNKKSSNALSTGIDDFYSMFDNFFNDGFWSRRDLRGDTFKVDVEETENAYIIEAEIPGVSKNEISLDLEDGRLTITISHDESKKEEKRNYIHRERRYTSMRRSIYLADAKQEEVSAKLEDGLLKISVPKKVREVSSCKINIE